MELLVLKNEFSVCQVEDYSQVDFEREYIFTAQTTDEKSLLCRIHAYVICKLKVCFIYFFLLTKISGFQHSSIAILNIAFGFLTLPRSI